MRIYYKYEYLSVNEKYLKDIAIAIKNSRATPESTLKMIAKEYGFEIPKDTKIMFHTPKAGEFLFMIPLENRDTIDEMEDEIIGGCNAQVSTAMSLGYLMLNQLSKNMKNLTNFRKYV